MLEVFDIGICRVSGQQSPSPSPREQVIVHQEIPLAKVALSLIKLMLMPTTF